MKQLSLAKLAHGSLLLQALAGAVIAFAAEQVVNKNERTYAVQQYKELNTAECFPGVLNVKNAICYTKQEACNTDERSNDSLQRYSDALKQVPVVEFGQAALFRHLNEAYESAFPAFDFTVFEYTVQQLPTHNETPIQSTNTKILVDFELCNRFGELCFFDSSDKLVSLKEYNNALIDRLKVSSVQSDDTLDIGRACAISYAQQLVAQVVKNYLQNADSAAYADICNKLDAVLQEHGKVSVLEAHKKLFNIYTLEKHTIDLITSFLSNKATICDMHEV